MFISNILGNKLFKNLKVLFLDWFWCYYIPWNILNNFNLIESTFLKSKIKFVLFESIQYFLDFLFVVFKNFIKRNKNVIQIKDNVIIGSTFIHTIRKFLFNCWSINQFKKINLIFVKLIMCFKKIFHFFYIFYMNTIEVCLLLWFCWLSSVI